MSRKSPDNLGCGNNKLLPSLDFVGIVNVVRLGDGHVLIRIAVKLLADLREIVTRLNGVFIYV